MFHHSDASQPKSPSSCGVIFAHSAGRMGQTIVPWGSKETEFKVGQAIAELDYRVYPLGLLLRSGLQVVSEKSTQQ